MEEQQNPTPFRAVALAVAAVCVTPQTTLAGERLDPVVLTATGFEQALTEAPASISAISRDELERDRYTNLAEALADIPGVDVRSGTGKTGGLDVSIRGMPSEYTLIMIDGRRQNASGDVTPNGFGETSTSFMPPVSAIERIEVVRGPMSTLYGSDAMGGVVNVITRPVTDRWTTSLGIENTFHEDSSAGNESALNLFTSGPLIEDRLGIQLRGRLFDRDGSARLIDGAIGRDPRPADGRIYSIGGRVAFTPDDRNTLWLDLEQSRQRYDNADSRLGVLDETDRSTGEPSPGTFHGYEDELRFNRDQVAVGHEAAYALGDLNSSLSYITTETEGRTLPEGEAPEYGYSAQGGEPRTLENRDLVFDTRFVMPLGRHIVTVGGQYKGSELEDGAAGNETFAQESWAVFLEDEWWLRDDLALTMGARYEHHDAFGGHVAPRGYLMWSAAPAWTFKGGVSQGYKVPTLNDLHDGITGFTSQGASVNIGSPDLEPEESSNYEVGAIYDDGRLHTAVTLFHNRFTDRIAEGQGILNCQYEDEDGNTPYSDRDDCMSVGDFTEQETFSQLVNVDRARTQGVELASRYWMTDNWQLSGGYTYTDTEITRGEAEGQVLTNAPEHMVSARLLWRATDRFSTWVDAEYYSSRERFPGGAPTSGESLSIYEQVGNRLDAYELFHLGAAYRISDMARLTARVYNVFDKDFSRGERYQHEGETGYAYRYSQTGRSVVGGYRDGRHVWLSANFDF